MDRDDERLTLELRVERHRRPREGERPREERESQAAPPGVAGAVHSQERADAGAGLGHRDRAVEGVAIVEREGTGQNRPRRSTGGKHEARGEPVGGEGEQRAPGHGHGHQEAPRELDVLQWADRLPDRHGGSHRHEERPRRGREAPGGEPARTARRARQDDGAEADRREVDGADLK